MKVLFTAVLLTVFIGGGCSEYRSNKWSPPTLAVEFEEQFVPAGLASTRHLNIGNGGSSGMEYPFSSLRPLAGSATAPRNGSLDLEFTAKADQVVTTLYDLPPESDLRRYSEGHKRLLGTHSARLNETFALDELKKIGYTPFTIKVVKATAAPTAHPALSSKVPSIQIVIAEDDALPHLDDDGETPSCWVKLHNLSSRGVAAYVLSDGGNPKTGDTESHQSFNTYGKPLIAPGKDSRAELISFGQATRMTPQGLVNIPPKPQQIVVEAVLFTDGSVQGEPAVAAHLKGRQIENLAIYRLVTPAIDRIVGDSKLNDDQRVARIKDEIYRIPSAPDEATIQSLRAGFPALAGADLATQLNRNRDAAKNELWSNLYAYVHKCCEYPPPDHISVATWWRNERSQIEPLLNSSN